jgi:hypothetical protein
MMWEREGGGAIGERGYRAVVAVVGVVAGVQWHWHCVVEVTLAGVGEGERPQLGMTHNETFKTKPTLDNT